MAAAEGVATVVGRVPITSGMACGAAKICSPWRTRFARRQTLGQGQQTIGRGAEVWGGCRFIAGRLTADLNQGRQGGIAIA